MNDILERIKDLDEIPSPYLTGILDKFFDGNLTPEDVVDTRPRDLALEMLDNIIRKLYLGADPYKCHEK